MTEPIWHDVELSTGGWGPTLSSHLEVGKETVHLTFEAVWRGRPVVVTMQADRYVHSNGWSEWRVYAERAREDVGPNGGLGADLTETARHRLSDEFKPVVEKWLESDEYTLSARMAVVGALKALAGRLRYDSRDLRTAVNANRKRLTAADAKQLLGVADAYDAFQTALEAVGK